VSAYKTNVEGDLRRQKAFFSRMLVLVMDDAKMATLNGEVSYVIETSPGKCQAGIFLDAEDPDCADIELCSKLVTKMVKANLIGDKGGNAVTRYVRLPVGQTQKPRESGNFTHELSLWQPHVRLTLAEAAKTVGVDLQDILDSLRKVGEQSEAKRVTEHRAAVMLGEAPGQDERLEAYTQNILAGVELHDSINGMAASMVAGGAAGGTVVNQLRALMKASAAPRDARWQSRFVDISRAVTSAEQKYRRMRMEPALQGSRFQVSGDQVISTDNMRPLLTKAGSLLQTLNPPRWIIKGLLESDALGLMYGAPGDGKSFIAIGIACCVATGATWHGRRVKAGPVIYIAGEGLGGISRRLHAWQKDRGVNLGEAPLYISTRAISLLNAESALAVAVEVEATLPDGSPAPALVVIDTVARAFVGGDESSTQDMSNFVNIIDTMLKNRWGAHVLLIHHAGKDASKGARGSSALKGALDQEFAIEKHVQVRKLICTKMKDAEPPEDLAFKLRGVELARVVDEFDEETVISSAVVDMLDASQMPVSAKRRKAQPNDTDMTPEALVEIIRGQGWPGLTRIQDIFGCGRAQAVNLVKKAEELNLIAGHGKGNRRRYEITVHAALPC